MVELYGEPLSVITRSTWIPWPREVCERATQEPDRRDGFLVGENFGVCQARGVVDRDMHVIPAPPCAGPRPAASVKRPV